MTTLCYSSPVECHLASRYCTRRPSRSLLTFHCLGFLPFADTSDTSDTRRHSSVLEDIICLRSSSTFPDKEYLFTLYVFGGPSLILRRSVLLSVRLFASLPVKNAAVDAAVFSSAASHSIFSSSLPDITLRSGDLIT